MKVAFFNYLPMTFGGGLAQFYTEITTGLSKRFPSAKTQVISFDEKTAQLIQGMYSTYFLRNETLTGSKKATHPTGHTISQVAALLSEFDLIYSKNDILDLTLLSLARITHRLPPVVIGFHTPIHYARTPTIQSQIHNVLYSSFYYRSLLKQASGFHVLNEFHRETINHWFPNKPLQKIYNPVDSSLFRPASHKAGASLRLLWIGRLTPDKGCDELIKLIKSARRRVAWTIVGDGALRQEIQQLTHTRDNVIWHSHLDPSALAKQYRGHDAFISTSNWECLPYTALEAQYCGLPVIGYDIPGNRDIVDRHTGILVTKYDSLESAIVHFKPTRFKSRHIRSVTMKRFDANKSYRTFYSFLKYVYEQSLR
ncbi:glycosyltransferase family 4 protein [Candidatus Microgenomates bacterium]|nr:glycosyltransferase family 4 protein [Candidatus Microgenomates bacterium]